MFIGQRFIKLPPNTGKRFNVFRRDTSGFVRRIGVTYANDKHQADFKARATWKPKAGEVVWCEEIIKESVA